MGKPIPYTDTAETVLHSQDLHLTCGKRQFYGFIRSLDTGLPQLTYP